MVKRNTKKVTKPLSLGGLRKGLEHMKMCAVKMSVPEFQKEYKKVFGKAISTKEAKLYMDSMKVKKGQSGGQKPSWIPEHSDLVRAVACFSSVGHLPVQLLL